MITLELPFPPVNNSYYRNITIGGRGRTIISAKGRKYSSDVAEIIGDVEPIDFRICMVVDVYPPDLRKRDLDGVLKALQDSITKAGFWSDDELIDDLRVIRKHKVPGGKVVVHISEIGA